MWEATILHLHIDSACEHKWITDTLMGKARVLTRVRSEHNREDSLTRVPQRWFDLVKKAVEPPFCASAASPSKHDFDWIRSIHHRSGHPGVKRTLYFIRQIDPTASVVRNCEKCQSIDPPPTRWPRGKLDVGDIWSQMGIDVTHYQGRHYMSLIDCGPTERPWRRDAPSCKGPVSRHRLEYLGEWEWQRTLNPKCKEYHHQWSTRWSARGKQRVCNGWHFYKRVIRGGSTNTTKERKTQETRSAFSSLWSWDHGGGCSEIEKQNLETVASDEPTGVRRSKRQRAMCCLCRQNSWRLPIFHGWIKKRWWAEWMTEMKCDNGAVWTEFLS